MNDTTKYGAVLGLHYVVVQAKPYLTVEGKREIIARSGWDFQVIDRLSESVSGLIRKGEAAMMYTAHAADLKPLRVKATGQNVTQARLLAACINGLFDMLMAVEPVLPSEWMGEEYLSS